MAPISAIIGRGLKRPRVSTSHVPMSAFRVQSRHPNEGALLPLLTRGGLRSCAAGRSASNDYSRAQAPALFVVWCRRRKPFLPRNYRPLQRRACSLRDVIPSHLALAMQTERPFAISRLMHAASAARSSCGATAANAIAPTAAIPRKNCCTVGAPRHFQPGFSGRSPNFGWEGSDFPRGLKGSRAMRFEPSDARAGVGVCAELGRKAQDRE